MPKLESRRLSHAIGAEVTGVDLRQKLDPATVDAIKALWDEHLLLLFRDQHITPAQHVAFTEYFGTPTKFEVDHVMEGHPEVLRITNKLIDGKPSNTRNTGRNWHSDQTWSDAPALGGFLRCVEKPEVGGDTLFTNLGLAYENLSPKLKEIIDGMEAVHDFSLVAGLDVRDPAYVAEMKRQNPPVIHKCVIVHPVTRRKFLFIGDRVRNFVGMSEEESKPFLQMYVRHATRAEFHYRHQWRVGDLIMWQNRYTMHYAPADFDQSQPRDMQRTTIIGDAIGRLVRPRQAA